MPNQVTSAPRTTQVANAQVFASGSTGTTAVAGVGASDELHLVVQCTAVSGTSPTLDAKLQTSYDGGATWIDVASGAITQLTAAGNAAKAVARGTTSFWGDRVRALCTVGGSATPTATASVFIFAR